MKRFGFIYPKIYDMDNLIEAHKRAKKDKLFYREVKMVDSNPEYYLGEIQNMLINKTYYISESDYSISTINDKGKDRELWKLSYYPHRIIQWAIMLQVENIFNKMFTNFTCASLKGRGIHKAYSLVTDYLKDSENTKYCLKVDIHHFYNNVDHCIIKEMLFNKFKDKDLLDLLYMIIDSRPVVGIPIGSYLSQYFANFYLSHFDHWLKEDLHVKYVVRYMDDIVVFSKSKEELHYILDQMKLYLSNVLNLELKDNYQIFPTLIRGVDFVGYRFFKSFTLLRKSTCKRFKKVMIKIRNKRESGVQITYGEWCSVNSYSGWLKWCNSYRLKEKYVAPIQACIENYYNTVIRKKVII